MVSSHRLFPELKKCVGWVVKNPYSFPLLVYFSLLNEICSSPTCSRKKWNRGAGVAYKTLYQCARKNMKIMYHQLWLLWCMNAICLCADIFANYSMTVDMDPKKIYTRPQLNIKKISAFQKPQDFEQSSALLSILPLMSTFFFLKQK